MTPRAPGLADVRGPGKSWSPFSPPTDDLDPHGVPVLVRGEGVWLTDNRGQRYLDGG